MKKFILLCLGAAALASCNEKISPSGNVLTVTRDVTEFDALAIGGGINATVTMGEEPALTISADDNVLPYIETFVRGGTLNVRIKNHTSFRGEPTLKATITAVELSDCSASGASSIKFTNELSTPSLNVDLSGASRYTGSSVAVDGELKATLSGASTMTTGGTASTLSLNCSGASTFGDFDFAANEADATLSGASHATLTVEQSLSVEVTGASSLRYKGEPTVDIRKNSGGSTVESAN